MSHEEEIRGILSNSLHADAVEKNKNLPDFHRVSGLNRYLNIIHYKNKRQSFGFSYLRRT
jgi:hypothetical protein